MISPQHTARHDHSASFSCDVSFLHSFLHLAEQKGQQPQCLLSYLGVYVVYMLILFVFGTFSYQKPTNF